MWFLVLDIVNSADMNIRAHLSLWIMVFSEYVCKSGIAESLLLLFSLSVVCDSLWPHELQHTRLTSPSLSPGVCSNSYPLKVSQVALVVKSPPANAGDVRDTGSIPGVGRFLGEGHGNPFQCSCVENPTGRGAWWATVHGAAKRWTWLKRLSTHSCMSTE